MRKILKVKTVGSRAGKNLRPVISDSLPQGVNMTVHLYNEVEETCILELWGSDNPILKENERISDKKIAKVLEHKGVVEELKNHPSCPEKLFAFSDLAEKYVVDDAKKTAKKEGKEHKFKRVEKRHRHGEDVDMIVFEEE